MTHGLVYTFRFFIFCLILFSVSKVTRAQVVAQDGTTYKTIKIGTKEWFKTNLNVSTFANGTTILKVTKIADWIQAFNEQKPAYCYYNFQDSNEIKFGKYYNWFAVSSTAKLAPTGWHIPSGIEWKELVDFLGSDIKIVSLKLKSKKGWIKYGHQTGSANGNNSSGFTALPAGFLNRYTFVYEGVMAVFWGSIYRPYGGPDEFSVNNENRSDYQGHERSEGFSVRCIKD